jgi:hypothetical protein
MKNVLPRLSAQRWLIAVTARLDAIHTVAQAKKSA